MKKVLVVGIGPGEYEQMTIRAASALREAQVIVGLYGLRDLVRAFSRQGFSPLPMTQEAERCQLAFPGGHGGSDGGYDLPGDGGLWHERLIAGVGQATPGEIEVIPRRLKSGSWLRRRRILQSACTIPPAGSGRITCAGPATCCSGSAVRRRFAAQSATSEGPGKAPRCVPWPSSGSWRRTCLPRCLWATPRPGSLGAIW